jgi:hypothetical protein
MKNIHVLPTDKPSRLLVNKENTLVLTSNYYSSSNPQNIYITSDEEIKEGDWVLKFPFGDEVFRCIEVEKDEYIKRKELLTYPYNWCKKIILTTDQDLIKDGVQAIPNEFLEWFVPKANDSGKPIDIVEVKEVYFHGSGYYDINQLSEQEKKLYSYLKEYKIIIPKEEPKQEFSTKLHKGEVVDDSYPKEFIKKQEQDKKMYSEEEAGELVYNIIGVYAKQYGIMIDGAKLNDLFEQFKKK